MWKIQKSQYVWKVHLVSTFFSESVDVFMRVAWKQCFLCYRDHKWPWHYTGACKTTSTARSERSAETPCRWIGCQTAGCHVSVFVLQVSSLSIENHQLCQDKAYTEKNNCLKINTKMHLMCLFKYRMLYQKISCDAYAIRPGVNTRKSCGFVKPKGFISFLWEC